MSSRKWACLILTIMVFGTLLAACAGSHEADSVESSIQMTEQEKTFMKRVSFDEQAVEKGVLEDWQEELLTEMRAGDEYLKKKYHGAALEIVNCETATSKDGYDRYTVLEVGDSEHFYEMRIKREDDKYVITDDYYEHVIQEEAQNIIKDMVEKAGLPCIKVKASFDAFFGPEYGEDIPVEDVLSGKINAENLFQIYLEAEKLDQGSYEDTVRNVQNLMKEHGIVGYFNVIIGTDDSKESVYREAFSVGN